MTIIEIIVRSDFGSVHNPYPENWDSSFRKKIHYTHRTPVSNSKK